MLQLAADLRLLDEPAHDFGIALVRLQQHLDRQLSAQVDVATPEDRPHAAPGDLALKLVAAQPAPSCIGHLGRPRHHQRLALVEQLVQVDLGRRAGTEVEGRQQARAGGRARAGRRWSRHGAGVLRQPAGQVHDLEVGPQLAGQRRVIGQQLVGVGRLAGLDAGEIGVQDAHDLGVILRAGGAGPRAKKSGSGS